MRLAIPAYFLLRFNRNALLCPDFHISDSNCSFLVSKMAYRVSLYSLSSWDHLRLIECFNSISSSFLFHLEQEIWQGFIQDFRLGGGRWLREGKVGHWGYPRAPTPSMKSCVVYWLLLLWWQTILAVCSLYFQSLQTLVGFYIALLV